MAKVTSLASVQITPADQLTIELVQATETPTTILIRWPDAPSVSDPRNFAAVAAAVTETFARARASLALDQRRF